MAQRTGVVRRRSSLLAGLLLALLGATAPRAATVYLSPDAGCDPSAPSPLEIPINSNVEFYLCIYNGSNESDGGICENGTGDELCAFDVTLIATGPLEFADFFPESDIVSRLEETRIRANGLPADPGVAPILIGRVVIASTDLGGTIEAMGQQVGAAGRLETIPNTVLAPLPEPDQVLLLAAGLALLALLQALRSRPARRSQPAADQQER